MKKTRTLLLILIFVLSLSGCQLARTDLESTGDRLVGVLVTEEYLDLFDMEAYLNDNLNVFKGDMVLDGDISDYQGRIYASIIPQTLTAEDGRTIEDEDLSFEDLDGIHFVAARVERDGEAFNRVYSSDGIINGHTGYHYGDEEESVTLEGEIWMAHVPGNITAYFNPVYVDSDGNYYVTPGQGLSSNGDNAVGGVFTQTLEESHTITENGKSKTISVSVTLSFGTMYEPEEYVLLQMDKDNHILRKDTYLPGELPVDLAPEAETEYLILETHNRLAQKNEKIVREIFNQNNDHFSTFCANEDGFMIEKHTFIQWD